MRSRSMMPSRRAGTATSLALAAALAGGAAAAQTGDYGPATGLPNLYFTRINKSGVSAWRLKVEEGLRARGFAEAQIKKFTRLRYVRPEEIKKGRAEFLPSALPVRYDVRTGKALPVDPVAFAAALPDCFKQDERDCDFVFSPENESQSDRAVACRLPRRTVAFCKRVGFNDPAKRSASGASCGDKPRSNGCGADEAVFDDGETQTKLAFSVEKALAAAPPPPIGSAETASFPKIVYRGFAFASREGPAQREEWEYDLAEYKRLQTRQGDIYSLFNQHASKNTKVADEPKLRAELGRIESRLKEIVKTAVEYCWPHDVNQPCDLE